MHRHAGRVLVVIVLLGAFVGCERSGGSGAPRRTDGPPLVRTDSEGLRFRPLEPPVDRVHCLVFVTVDCPLANSYAPELEAIHREYADRGVGMWLVHVDPDVDLVAARRHAAEYGHTTPLVLDPEHELVAAVGATVTPEAAVLTHDGGIVYRGRIDDWYADFGRKKPEPSVRDLRRALDAVLAGAIPEPARTDALGCFISDFK